MITHTRDLRPGDRVRFVSPTFPAYLGKQGIVIRCCLGELPAVIVQIDGDRKYVHGPDVLELVSRHAQS